MNAPNTNNKTTRAELFRQIGDLERAFKVQESALRKALILKGESIESENADGQRRCDFFDMLRRDFSTCRQLRKLFAPPFFQLLGEQVMVAGKIIVDDFIKSDMKGSSRIADPHAELLKIVETLSGKLPCEDVPVMKVCLSHRLRNYSLRLENERVDILNDSKKGGVTDSDKSTSDARSRANAEASRMVDWLSDNSYLYILIEERVETVLTPDRSKDLCHEVLALWSVVNESLYKGGIHRSGAYDAEWKEIGDREYRERNGERVRTPKKERAGYSGMS